MEAFSTFDVSVVEADNLCGLEYTFVIAQSPYQIQYECFFFLTSKLNSGYISSCDRLINAIWSSCLKPLHNEKYRESD